MLAKRILSLFAWMLVGIVLGVLIHELVGSIHEMLFKHFPNAIPLYNPVFERELYARQELIKGTVTLIIGIFLSVLLSLRFDNFRSEKIIEKTDGLFLIRHEYGAYTARFIIDDMFASASVASLISIPFRFIPEKFLDMSNIFAVILHPLYLVSSAIGGILLAPTVACIILLSHVAAAPLALGSWRARWITGFSEVR